ncbi:MAG TPA: phosphotransferase [Candidatus Dormibacteraeota bacterium]
MAVGGGSYHWRVGAFWVTADDLAQKPLGGLLAALQTAAALREAALDFVVAPLAALDGRLVVQPTPRWALALYPYLKGEGYEFHARLDADSALELAEMLAAVHTAAVSAPDLAELVPVRGELERALNDLDSPWNAGPYSERARQATAARAGLIRALLRELDELSEAVGAGSDVTTHGEPHPGNLLRVGGRLVLLDWDTVARAPRERDLCWLDGHPEALEHYARITGVAPDPRAMRLFRLRWRLDDIATFVSMLRAPHEVNEDTTRWIGWGIAAPGDG